MSSSWEPKNLFELAQKHWHEPIGIVFSVAAALLFEILLLNSVKANGITSVTVYLITAFVIIIIWLFSNRFPKTKKGKVGFVVSIQCSNDEENIKIREDFVATLRNLLKQGNLGTTFHFIEIPRHITKTINDIDDAHALKAKTKAHFIIYGRVRLRPLDGQDCHIIDLEGVVGHKPLPKEVSNLLAKEFSELFPRRIRIPTENDLLSFHFTTDWTECVAKYIIGIAAACSHDLIYAELLFQDVHNKLEKIETDFPVFRKLKGRLPIRFSEINQALARGYLDIWRKNHDQRALSKFVESMSKVPAELPQDYSILLLRGIEAFLNGRNVEKSIKYNKECKKYADPIWHFNLAFLRAYEGNLHKAIQQYRICINYDVVPQTLSQVEDFMVWILEVEPDKYQYHYCLGFFNWKIKGDLKQAEEDFKEFLNHSIEDQFQKEQELSTLWISEINNKMVNQAFE